MKTRVTSELKTVFRPEFLNRVDEVIVFRKLSRAEISDIVGLMMARVEEQLKDREIGIALTPEAKELLVDVGYDPTMGARPLRRAIQRQWKTCWQRKCCPASSRGGDSGPRPRRRPSDDQRDHYRCS